MIMAPRNHDACFSLKTRQIQASRRQTDPPPHRNRTKMTASRPLSPCGHNSKHQGINHAYDVIAPLIVFLVDVVFSMRTAARSDGLNLAG
jgi:hypothetical protein